MKSLSGKSPETPKVFDKNRDVARPYENRVCHVCKLRQPFGDTFMCPLHVNWGDWPGKVNDDQPYVLCEDIETCHHWEYDLDLEEIFTLLKEKLK